MQNKISKKAIFLILSVALMIGVTLHDQINTNVHGAIFECVGSGSYANTDCYNSFSFDPMYFLFLGIALVIIAIASMRDKISKISGALILVNLLTIGILIHDQLNYVYTTNYCSGFQSYFYVNPFGRECSGGYLDIPYFGLLLLATIIIIVRMLISNQKQELENNNQNIPIPPTQPQQKKWYQHKGIISIIILAVIAGVAVWAYAMMNQTQDLGPIVVQHKTKQLLIPAAQSTTTPITTESQIPNWQTYGNSQYGFSLRYPNSWVSCPPQTTLISGNDTGFWRIDDATTCQKDVSYPNNDFLTAIALPDVYAAFPNYNSLKAAIGKALKPLNARGDFYGYIQDNTGKYYLANINSLKETTVGNLPALQVGSADNGASVIQETNYLIYYQNTLLAITFYSADGSGMTKEEQQILSTVQFTQLQTNNSATAYGYIKSVYQKNNQWVLDVNPIQFFQGQAATNAYAQDNNCNPETGPNCHLVDPYYIRDNDKSVKTFPVSANVAITMVDQCGQYPQINPNNTNSGSQISFATFQKIFSTTDQCGYRSAPYLIQQQPDNTITAITEQYIP
jgi:hypothetical protein